MVRVGVNIPDAALAEWLRASVDAGLPLEDLLAISLADGVTQRANEAVRVAHEREGAARRRPGPDEIAAAMGGARFRTPSPPQSSSELSVRDRILDIEKPQLDRETAGKAVAGGSPSEVREGAMLPPTMLRMLPAKIGMRALCTALRRREWAEDEVVRSTIEMALASKRVELASIDSTRGRLRDGFSASFGSDVRSRARLVNAMVGPAGRESGCLQDLGWIRWSAEGCALTPKGLAFVQRRNPILDARPDHALSGPEREAILQAIASRLESEWNVMLATLDATANGPTSNHEVESAIAAASPFKDERASLSTLRACRVATVGRMVELGLILRRWSGRTVSLTATDEARDRMASAEGNR